MSSRFFWKVAIVSSVILVAGLWAYNSFPQFQRLVGGGSGTPLKKVA